MFGPFIYSHHVGNLLTKAQQTLVTLEASPRVQIDSNRMQSIFGAPRALGPRHTLQLHGFFGF